MVGAGDGPHRHVTKDSRLESSLLRREGEGRCEDRVGQAGRGSSQMSTKCQCQSVRQPVWEGVGQRQ
jgi:hypothetical protein